MFSCDSELQVFEISEKKSRQEKIPSLGEILDQNSNFNIPMKFLGKKNYQKVSLE